MLAPCRAHPRPHTHTHKYVLRQDWLNSSPPITETVNIHPPLRARRNRCVRLYGGTTRGPDSVRTSLHTYADLSSVADTDSGDEEVAGFPELARAPKRDASSLSVSVDTPKRVAATLFSASDESFGVVARNKARRASAAPYLA